MSIAERGFTLVELIVAAAVLGLLAAIALPHYAGALVRGKIAAAKANIHACQEALEAYRIDHDGLPPSRYFCYASGEEGAKKYYELPFELTTPLAYLQDRPLDPFYTFTGASDQAPGQTIKYRKPGLGYFNSMPTNEGIWVPRAFPADHGDYVFYNDASDEHPSDASPVEFGLWSVGPIPKHDIGLNMLEPVPASTWYDPSNGTVSIGIITRLSTGHSAP